MLKVEKKGEMAKDAALAASALLLVAGAAPVTAALAAEPASAAGAAALPEAQPAVGVVAQAAAVRTVDASQAAFAWDQTTLTPNSTIRDTFRPATATLCSATTEFARVDPMDWQIVVGGDVQAGFVATVGELAGEQTVSQTLTCSCGGNPADGRAIATAEIEGVPIAYLVSRAAADADVNTITFVCSDGTEVALPLGYVVGRHGVIGFNVNGEPVSETTGGSNQLWLAGTAGNYMVRDIVSIEVTHEENVPASPADDEHPNSPNVGILSGTVG